MQITELHCHDYYSPMDGLNSPEEYMIRAKELGMTHLAQTNHGTLAGHRHFQKATQEAGIIPILGIEAYISSTDRFDKRAKNKRSDGTSVYNHIILLAKDGDGLSNLNRLSEIAWSEGFYSKPRIDLDVLFEYKDGLVVLSGCLNGLIAKALENNDFYLAESIAKQLHGEFGDDFYIEIQAENPININSGLLSIADKLKIEPVVTGDCHYANPKDRWIEEAWLILSTQPKLNKDADLTKAQKMEMLERFDYLYPDRKMTFKDWDLFLAGRETREQKLKAQGIDREDIYTNTNIIADKIAEYPFHSKLDLLPAPKAENPQKRLEDLCRQGMNRLGFKGKKEYEDRLNEELSVVAGKGFASYFVIEANAVNWASKQGIMTGPARGCLKGDSLVSTPMGYRRLRDIVTGDVVYDMRGKSVKVTDTMKYNYDEDLLNIKTYYGNSGISMTSDHKVLVSPVNKETDKKLLSAGYKFKKDLLPLEWREAKDIAINDLLVKPIPDVSINDAPLIIDPVYRRPSNKFGKKTLARQSGFSVGTINKYINGDQTKATAEFAAWIKYNNIALLTDIGFETTVSNEKIEKRYDSGKLFGIFISDGWLTNRNNSLGFCVRKSEDDGEILRLIKDVLGVTPTIYDSKNTDLRQFEINHKGLYDLFDGLFPDYKRSSATKYIPMELLETNKDFRRGLLDGLWYGDGSFSGRTSYSTVSENLANNCKFLLETLGLHAGITKTYRQEFREGWRKRSWVEYKVTTTPNFGQCKNQMGAKDDNYIYYRVKDINLIAGDGYVYDITVPDTHSYLTDCYVVHNSGAGSLINHVLGITKIDPIKYNLLFSRFLDPERPDWPDVDLDIQDDRRGELKKYMQRQYKNVASITTINKLGGKSALNAAARILGVPYSEASAAMKLINGDPKFSSEQIFELYQSNKELSDFRKKWPDVIVIARAISGRPASYGMHAGGLVVSKEPLSNIVPLETRDDKDDDVAGRIPVVAYDMNELEEIGLIKYDFLGLKTLSVISNCLKAIKERKGIDVDLYGIKLDDPNIYKMISDGHTQGIFQAEAAPSTKLIIDMGIDNFDELVASNALVRPGAFDTIGKNYLARKRGKEKVQYIHPIMEEYTKDTYGLIVYQEQVMQACQHLAGMSGAEANKVRKVIGKKQDAKELLPYKERFIDGAVKHISKAAAEKLWHDFEAHAGYSFNKCLYYGTKIQMADGSVKTISQIAKLLEKQDVYVNSMWSDGIVRPHKVKAVAKTGRKNLYKLTTESGRKLHLTEDHRLLTNDGYKPLKNIAIGDELIVSDKWVSEKQKLARSSNMKKLRSSEVGRQMDERAAKRMCEYQKTLTYEDKSRHQKYVSATTDRTVKVVPHLNRGFKQAWQNENWRVAFMEKTLAAPRGYLTGSGYGSSGYAKDGVTWCASIPERELCDWLIDLNIPFQAHKVLPSGRMCDFYVDGLYIEMDGMDRTYEYFKEKYNNMPFIVVTPEDYKEVLSATFKVMHVRNGDRVISIEESGYNKSNNNYTMDIEMEPSGPKNFITIDGIVSHNSHAVGYSLISYWTAWLKYYYPVEFLWALIKAEKKTNDSKLTDYLIELKRLGLKIYLPHVNKSEIELSMEEDGIRLGLSNIKYISHIGAMALIKHRPYKSYAHLKEKVEEKGSGLNSRMLSAMNLVGAATFDDNPKTGNEKHNYYEYLGLPTFSAIDDGVKSKIRDLEYYEDKGSFFILGMVKKIKRGQGWSRVDVVDSTGSVGVFANENTQILEGRQYVILVSDNRIMSYISSQDVENRIEHPIIDYLVGGVNLNEDEYKVLAFSARKTKTNTMMAYVTLVDHLNQLESALVFNSNYIAAYAKCIPGAVVNPIFGTTKDGSLFIKGFNSGT